MPPRFTLVRCSVDPARLAESTAGYERAFAGEPFESIVVTDARSLAEAYDRALARARGEFAILSHDDAWPVSPGAIDRLAAHLREVDVVGIAGASAALSAAWTHAGQPHLHGHVVNPAEDGGVQVLIWGAEEPLVRGIRLLDGCFLAARTAVARAVGFDAARFDGFHGYDADFALRASLAGYAVAVAADVTVFHRSRGSFGPEWERYAARFAEAHGAALDRWLVPGPARKGSLRCVSLEEAARTVDFALVRGATRKLRGG